MSESIELTDKEVLTLIKNKKEIEVSISDQYKFLDRSKSNNVVTKEKMFFLIERDYLNQITINDTENTVKTYANLILYFLSNNNDGKVYKITMKIPCILSLNFSYYFKDGDNIVFVLEENMKIFKSNLYQNDVEVASSTFSTTINGKVNDIPKLDYDKLPVFLSDVLENNEIKGNISLPLEILISGLCRSSTDNSVEFRHIVKKNEYAYDRFNMINIREVPRNNSAFSAISSENISEGLITTLINNKSTGKNRLSPMESIALNKFR